MSAAYTNVLFQQMVSGAEICSNELTFHYFHSTLDFLYAHQQLQAIVQ